MLERERCGLAHSHGSNPPWPFKEAAPIAEVIAGKEVTRALGRLRMERAELLAVLQEEWGALVGEDIARRTRPIGIEDGALIVEVAGAVWYAELRRTAFRTIEGRVQTRFGKSGVRKVILRQG